MIAKLGNRSAYEYTEADVKKIAKALSKRDRRAQGADALHRRQGSRGL